MVHYHCHSELCCVLAGVCRLLPVRLWFGEVVPQKKRGHNSNSEQWKQTKVCINSQLCKNRQAKLYTDMSKYLLF